MLCLEQVVYIGNRTWSLLYRLKPRLFGLCWVHVVSSSCICCSQGKTGASGLCSDLMCDLATVELTQMKRSTSVKGLVFIPLGKLLKIAAGNASGHYIHPQTPGWDLQPF